MRLIPSNQKQSDEELMECLQQGQKWAFEKLYDRYFDKLVWYGMQYLHDKSQAEDIVQEVFITVIEKPETFKKEKVFSTWIYTITGNRCKNKLRDDANRSQLLNKQSIQSETHMEHQHDYLKMKQSLQSIVNDLSDSHRRLFVLRFEHQLPIKQIAELTQSPEGTVKSGIFYLLKKISSQLNYLTHEK